MKAAAGKRRGSAAEQAALPLILLPLLLIGLGGCIHGYLVPPARTIEAVPGEGLLPRQTVAAGVSYRRIPELGISPAVHLLEIDKNQPDLEFYLPPPFPRGAAAEDLEDTDDPDTVLIAAWNGSPFRYRRDSRREGGERLMEPAGLWISEGVHYGKQTKDWGLILMDPSGGLSVQRSWGVEQPVRWAAGGYLPILEAGRNIGIHGERRARTAMGLSRDGGTVYVCIVEGERFSVPGLTSKETAEVLRAAGAWDALNLDGGDSTTFLLRRSGGETILYRAGRKKLPCYLLLRAASK